MKQSVLFACLLILTLKNIVESQINFKRKKLVILLTKIFTPCSNDQNYPVEYSDVSLKNTQSGVLFNYTISFKEDIPNNDLSIEIAVNRCRSQEALDSCIKFTKIKSRNVCGMVSSETDIWTPLVKCADPKLACPFKKGAHIAKNCFLDTSKYMWFPLDSSFWKMKVRGFYKDTVYGCGLVEGTAKYIMD